MSSDEESPSPTKSTPETVDLSVKEGVAHMLPCNIDYQGMASTHIFFRPVEENGVCYSALRGRGLLALHEEEADFGTEKASVSAALLSVGNNRVQEKARIDTILDWRHEHNPDSLILNNGGNSNRVQSAREWCDVADAVRVFLVLESLPFSSSACARSHLFVLVCAPTNSQLHDPIPIEEPPSSP